MFGGKAAKPQSRIDSLIGEEDIERFAALQAQLEQALGELIHAGREAPDAAATVD